MNRVMHQVALDLELLDKIHKYWFMVDTEGKVVHFGPGLTEHLIINQTLFTCFTISTGDATEDSIANNTSALKEIEQQLCKLNFIQFPDESIEGYFKQPQNSDYLYFFPITNYIKKLSPLGFDRRVFFDALLDNIPADVAIFSPDFRFLFINKRAIKDDELRKWLIGKTEFDFWSTRGKPLDQAHKRIEGFKWAIANRRTNIVEEVSNAGTEKERHFIRITTPFFEDGEIKYLLAYGIDVTELKQSQKQLEVKHAELVQVNAELDQFVYSASHNLRAPLMAILGLANLISADASAAEIVFFVRNIQKSVHLLDETIRDIIDYSQNSRMPVENEAVDIGTIVKDEFDRLHFFNKGEIKLTVEPTPNVIITDKKRITFIIRNLLSNSYRYSDDAKNDKFIQISINRDIHHSILVFKDNGIGIAADIQPRVFDMFYRGTSKSTGAGLGLFICKQIVHKLNGSISLKSEVNVGTTFEVRLPSH